MSWRTDSCDVVHFPFTCGHLKNWKARDPYFAQRMWVLQMPEVVASFSSFPHHPQSCGYFGHSNTCSHTSLFQLYVNTLREKKGNRLTFCFWKQDLQGRMGWEQMGVGEELKKSSFHLIHEGPTSPPGQNPKSSPQKICVSPFSNSSHGKLGRIRVPT